MALGGSRNTIQGFMLTAVYTFMQGTATEPLIPLKVSEFHPLSAEPHKAFIPSEYMHKPCMLSQNQWSFLANQKGRTIN